MEPYPDLSGPELERIKTGMCPDCGTTDRWQKGPEGGAATNWRCGFCGARFNVTPPFFYERISHPFGGVAGNSQSVNAFPPYTTDELERFDRESRQAPPDMYPGAFHRSAAEINLARRELQSLADDVTLPMWKRYAAREQLEALTWAMLPPEPPERPSELAGAVYARSVSPCELVEGYCRDSTDHADPHDLWQKLNADRAQSEARVVYSVLAILSACGLWYAGTHYAPIDYRPIIGWFAGVVFGCVAGFASAKSKRPTI